MLAGVWAFAEFTPGIEDVDHVREPGRNAPAERDRIEHGLVGRGLHPFLLAAGRGMAWLESRFADWKPRYS